MWVRPFIATWSFVFLALLAWMIPHKSTSPVILGRYSSTYFILLMTIAVLAVMSILAQTSIIYMRIYKARRQIIILLSSLLFSLITVEIAIRVFDPLSFSYFAELRKYRSDLITDPILVFKHTPNLQRTYKHFEVSINELGLRDRKLEKKQNGELRILLLGDSLTFGWGIPVEATFGRKLETTLASRLGLTVRTVNAGVSGYNTVQEYAFLRTYADLIEPDIVILIYISNDIETQDPPFDPWLQNPIHWESPSNAIHSLLMKSWLYRLTTFVLQYSHVSDLGFAVPEILDKNVRGVKESMDALTSIATFCRERGIKFVTFFYHPKESQLSRASVTYELLLEVQKIGNANGFHVRDTGSWWGNIDMQSVRVSRTDAHPNERGHEILAAGMADFLMSHSLVRKIGAYPDSTLAIFE
jgi:lysophospholipase L1-like esterase